MAECQLCDSDVPVSQILKVYQYRIKDGEKQRIRPKMRICKTCYMDERMPEDHPDIKLGSIGWDIVEEFEDEQ